MYFAEHQAQARRISRRLLWLYAAAVAAVVLSGTVALMWVYPWARLPEGEGLWWRRSPEFIVWTATALLALVVGGSVYKGRQLSGGGSVVAEALGGRQVLPATDDVLQRRLLNVVAEMALAAGLPMPKVYLLPGGHINALAAGQQPDRAVIAVSEGALLHLARDELQAVVAHEFSHILHGDMRLNMRLTSLLHGLAMVGMAGHYLLLGPKRDHRLRRDRDGEAQDGWGGPGWIFGVFGMAIGLVLMVVGFSGSVLAGWLQAAVCRQREYLADASAVQFTRYRSGLVGALRKIARHPPSGSQHWQAGEYAHFLFAPLNPDDWLTRLAATHPSLRQRMARIDARAARSLDQAADRPEVADYRGWLAFGSSAGHNGDGQALVSEWLQPVAGDMAATVATDPLAHGQPQHLAYAAWLRHSLPPVWWQASQDVEQAPAMLYALLLSEHAATAAAQQAVIQAQHPHLWLRVAALYRQRGSLRPVHVLPLVDLAVPALQQQSAADWQRLWHLLSALRDADGQWGRHQWCVWTVVRAHRPELPAAAPLLRTEAGAEQAQVLAWAAADQAAYTTAYAAAAVALDLPPAPPARSLAALQQALQRLNGLPDADKQQLLRLAIDTVQHDGRISVAERELLHAIAANLHWPLPPLLAPLPERPVG